uniref:UDP-glucuronosyltransferase 2B16-like n=1 Tax=Hirondellea gigas TaxID=1518452 RepID=A0A6A7G7A9_9CRUS
MMKWLTLSAVLLAFFCTTGSSYEVLLAAPVSTSYVNYVFCNIARALCTRGNKVTIISMHPPNFSHENFTIVRITTKKTLLKDLNLFEVNSTTLNAYVADLVENTAETMWEGFKVKDILEEKEKFDAIIIPAFLNEIAYPFLEDFAGVFVSLYSQGAEHYIVSHANETSYTPINPSLDEPYFGEYSLQDKFLYSVSALNNLNVENQGIFPGMENILGMNGYEMDNLAKYRGLSRLNLVDGHFALNGATPLMPKQIEIGTIVAKPAGDVPLFVEEFLRAAKGDGIVYVSFGTHTNSSEIPKSFKLSLLTALAQLPYKVLWQYDGMDLDKYDNILLRKIMPQQDILGHPDTRAFISHCSLPAIHEAAYHGVPVLGIPVALDQHRNAARLVEKGLGTVIDWRYATNDSIVNAVVSLLRDQTYSENMKQVSRLIKDQKESPADRAAWWIEHVIRQNGAPHMQYDPAQHAVRSYCDNDLLKLWATLGLFVGFAAGAVLVLMLRALYDCVFVTSSTKQKEE